MSDHREAILFYMNKLKQRRNDYALRKSYMMRKLKLASHLRIRMFLNKQAELKRLYFGLILNHVLSDESSTGKPTSVWRMPRSPEMHIDFWNDRVLRTYSEIEFHQDFRMSKKSFVKLCDLVRDRLYIKTTKAHNPVTIERQVAMTLYKLSTPEEFRTVGNLFNVDQSTTCTTFNEATSVIREVIEITYPTGDKLNEVIEGFSDELGFPQCCGAIDATHFPIVAPDDFPKDYCNRKGWHSVIMQSVVDHKGRFLDINIGWPGSVHESRVLRTSSFCIRANAGTLLPHRPKILEDTEIPLLFIGDSAYPLKNWLMKGFSENDQLTNEQRHFNFRISHALKQVENCLEKLKGRWRCLLIKNSLKLENLLTAIAACCSLHNYCEIEKEVFNPEWLNLSGVEDQFVQPTGYSLRFAQTYPDLNIRNALVKHFYRQKKFLAEQ